MSITTAQIRGARGILNWSQQDLAQRTSISATSIGSIENGQTTPRESTLATIRKILENNGIEFVENGVRQVQKTLQVYEGDDCYIKVLDLAYLTLSKTKGEIMFSGADEKRSPPAIVEKLRAMRRSNIKMRSLIREGDDFIMGKPSEYRWMNESLFIDTDVKVVFSNFVVYFASWQEVKKAIVIQDENIAGENRRMFDYIWDHADGPKKTSATVLYE